MGFIPTRTAIVNDTGFGLDGTVLDNAWKQELYDQIEAGVQRVLTTSTVTGAQNNYAPSGFSTTAGHCTLPWNGAADSTWTGFAAGIAGQRLTIRNLSATKVLYFAHNSGSSTFKFQNIATSGLTPIAAGGFATFECDGTNWPLIAHEQGAWITPTFAAGYYTANGAQTWTVAGGNVGSQRYMLRGRTVTSAAVISASTAGGTPNSQLIINNGAWGGFTAVGSTTTPVFITNNAITETGVVVAIGTTLVFERVPITNNWTGSASTGVQYVISFEVT